MPIERRSQAVATNRNSNCAPVSSSIGESRTSSNRMTALLSRVLELFRLLCLIAFFARSGLQILLRGCGATGVIGSKHIVDASVRGDRAGLEPHGIRALLLQQ